MPIDNLPNAMIVPSRDETREKYLRDYRLRNPTANTSQKSEPYVDASVTADTLVPVFANAKQLGEYAANQNRAGAALDAEAERLGTGRLPPAGGVGYWIVDGASAGGGTIQLHDEIRAINNGGLRFECAATGLYRNGDVVPIAGIDTGPATNLPAGTTLQWTRPRPGIPPAGKLLDQGGGVGTSGGRNQESDQDLDLRLVDLRANPPAAGNDAEYQAAIEETPGIFPQKGFTYPAIVGPGSTAFCFTMRPGSPGASRKPTAAQIAAVLAYIVGRFPGDDSISACTILEVPTALVFAVTWSPSAVGWADTTPWPRSADKPTVSASPAPTPTSFRLATGAGGPTQPQVGQTIAFYDAVHQTFRQKRILTVSGTGPWDIVVDTSNAASDLTYTPVAGQYASPWSESLDALAPPAVAYFDALGPGEQVASPFDPGVRQRRSPRSPQAWPSVITGRVLAGLETLSTVEGIDLLLPTLPHATPVGTAGVSSNLLTLGDLAAYAA